jgi:hypothetical protein
MLRAASAAAAQSTPRRTRSAELFDESADVGARLIALCSRVTAAGERTSLPMKRPPGRLILFCDQERPAPNIET